MEQQLQQNDQIITTVPVINSNDNNVYVPSSVEKKRALIMYFLFGIMIVIADKKTNDFEYFHLKQAIWWWISFMVFLVVSLFILFLPLIKYVGILLLLVLMGIFVILAKQAWDGKYHPDLKGYPLAIFPSLWTWLLSLFEIKFDDGMSGGSSQNVPPVPPIWNIPNA